MIIKPILTHEGFYTFTAGDSLHISGATVSVSRRGHVLGVLTVSVETFLDAVMKAHLSDGVASLDARNMLEER